MSRLSARGLLLALLFLPALGLYPLAAQENPPTRPEGEALLDIAAIRSRIAAVARNTELDEGLRTRIANAYQDAVDQLTKASDLTARGDEYERLVTQAPRELERIRGILAQAPAKPEPKVPPGANLSVVEGLRESAEGRLADAREAVGSLKAESASRTERQGKASQELARIERADRELEDQLKAPPPEGTDLALVNSLKVRLRAQRRALAAESRALTKEVASYEGRRELLAARLDLANREAAVAERAAKAWQELATKERQLEAERARQQAEEAAQQAEERLRREATETTPQLLALANVNRSLAELRAGDDGTSAQLAQIDGQLTEVRQLLTDLRASFKLVRRKVKVAGVTNALGQLLRKKLDALVDVGALERRLAARQERLADVQYQLILREEERLEAGDVAVQLDETLRALTPAERGRLEGVARELLTARRTLLDALIADYNLLFNRMVELDATARQLIQGTNEYRSFIEERILWVRSVAGSTVPEPLAAAEAIGWLVAPTGAGDALRLTLKEGRSHWAEALLWVSLFLLLLALSRWCHRGLDKVAQSVWKPQRDAYAHSLQALVFTVVLALPFPLLLWGLGWWISRPAGQTVDALAMAAGLQAMGELLLGLELIRLTLVPKGLGLAHFRWRSSSLSHLAWHFRWFTPALLLTTYVVVALDTLHSPRWDDSLGRIAFMAKVGALSVFIQRVLRPEGPIISNYFKRYRSGWVGRLRYVWYPVAIGLPIVLGLVSLRGYHYTSLKLLNRTQDSLWLVLGLILAHAFLLRWLRLTRTRLIHHQIAAEAEAAEARKVAAAEAEAKAKADAEAKAAAQAAVEAEAAKAAAAEGRAETPPLEEQAPPDHPPLPPTRSVPRPSGRFRHVDSSAVELETPSATTLDLEEVDHAALSSQAQRFFRALIALAAVLGFVWIWADVLPALRRLDQVQVWPQVRYLEAEEEHLDILEAAEPQAHSEGIPQQQPQPGPSLPGSAPAAPVTGDLQQAIADRLTLADVGLSILALLLTVIAAQTVPGLLEFLLLSRVNLDSGTRYAVRTVARYAIVFVGVSIGLGMIGFRWDSIQWLAAALTFGLAFGLQEIFANFVSGLIILFERPVRLGDWVTVGEITGVVSRIRIRATTITDRDNKELIIPNKEFVTGNVINWALSDSIVRVKIPVGVAYGTDPLRTRAALLSVASENPRVLAEPPAQALFLGFGDSSLNWELQAYIGHPAHLMPITDELHSAVALKFKKDGLEIAFPQLDLHLRSDGGLLNALHPSPSEPAATAPSPPTKP